MTVRVSPHPDEDRLLELAYGEAPSAEARTLRQHVDGCTRCRDVLQGIAEVRSAVRSVPPDPAPERGLESLLAYGEEAAARARSRRRSFRLVGLLSVATAVALAWILLPMSPRERPGSQDMLARADAPARGQAEPAFAEPKVAAPAPAPPVAEEKMKAEQARKEVSGAIVAMAPKTAERQKDAAKVAAPELKASSAPASPPAAVAISKRAAPKPERNSTAATSPPAVAMSTAPGGSPGHERAPGLAAGGQTAFGDGRMQADRSRSATAPNAGTGSAARAVSNAQKARTASEASVDKKQRMNGAEIAAAAAPAALGEDSKPAGALRPADRPPKVARLEQVRREMVQAAGDHRKALLLEQCRLEAELQMGPAAVQTCSQVAREFPGTPEAKQATELASGFSVQPSPR
jgi:hypothetical protein